MINDIIFEIENSPKIVFDVSQEADEIFLTNAGYGMRWVANCGNKKYINKVSQEIFQSIVAPLYPISSF